MRSDISIRDVLSTLVDPEDYVRGVLGGFSSEGFNREAAVVRIGISGTGIQPHYCIEEGEVTQTFPENNIKLRGYNKRVIFHGRSHKLILEQDAKGISWSSTTATYIEVQSILGELRGKTKRR